MPDSPERRWRGSPRAWPVLQGLLPIELYGKVTAEHPDHPGTRAVIVVDITRVSDSCGYGVPVMDLVGERDLLRLHAEHKGPDGMAEYRATVNAASIDGLPGYPAASDRPPAAPRRACAHPAALGLRAVERSQVAPGPRPGQTAARSHRDRAGDQAANQLPVTPSAISRRMSRCPLCRAVSSTRWFRIHRSVSGSVRHDREPRDSVSRSSPAASSR